jgi:hypothetical protein
MRSLSLAIGFACAISLSNMCSAQIVDNPFSQYIERGVTITPGAGNAKDANAAIHTIDPWPAYAGYTRIPRLGQGAVSSIERMNRFPNPFLAQQPGFGAGPSGGSIGAGVSSGSETGIGAVSGGSVTPVQPISSGNY